MGPFEAARAGTLPTETEPTVGGVRLPPGRLVAPSRSLGSPPDAPPVLWVTEHAVATLGFSRAGALWRRVAAGFPTHGLWPIVLASLSDTADERPWLAGELGADATSPAAHDIAAMLAEMWSATQPQEEEDEEPPEALTPFGRDFPGLAAASRAPVDATAPASVAGELRGRLGLVAVTRPADAPAALRWLGPANQFEDMGQLSAVLRSWEDRFGAVLVGLGFATMTLAVQRPVLAGAHALALAAEHCALCSDNIFQNAGTIARYAEALAGARRWDFWWD